jgi:hypothetical protein
MGKILVLEAGSLAVLVNSYYDKRVWMKPGINKKVEKIP